MKTFISYESTIKVMAGNIKSYLDNFNFNCFLAHEDIIPQNKWPEDLDKALKSSSLFLPILTPEFKQSFYCQQETGFACCQGIQILPVMVSQSPMGMISDLQAIKFNESDLENSCWKIVDHVAKNPALSKTVLDALIQWFGESDSYGTANARAKKVLCDYDFSDEQLLKIKSYIEDNSQIHETKNARDVIFDFMRKHKAYFDEDFISWYDSRKASRMWL